MHLSVAVCNVYVAGYRSEFTPLYGSRLLDKMQYLWKKEKKTATTNRLHALYLPLHVDSLSSFSFSTNIPH
jgi:hypothetical protein